MSLNYKIKVQVKSEKKSAFILKVLGFEAEFQFIGGESSFLNLLLHLRTFH